ncbi:transcription termination factor Rho [Tyzzerella nexilis]|nr:transcription termination factor Rho [[Clostridium] nexile]
MREKYESLSLAALRDIAKARKLKGVSTMKKSELIELMLEQDEKDKAKEVKEEIKNEKAGVADIEQLDSGMVAHGIIEVLPDGYGFIRSDNYLPGENDVYVSPSQIRRFGLKTGDIISGNTRIKTQAEKFSALLYLTKINGVSPSEATKRANFEDMTPIFPNERLRLENGQSSTAMRIVDLLSPIGKGQRGMIVSPPKAGKTTLLKQVAQSVLKNNPEMHLLILLIDERPEEVTDIKEAITGENVEVIYSTFDELPEHHRRVSEMVIERAKRLVEHKKDVMILLDSITRLARAYNLTVPPSGRTLSGGLDPAALHMPKRIFGAARNMREGGSLTILATALVDTGSKMDDVIYEEFKGTGNMELVLDRKLQEKRVFPAIDIPKSGTRREDLLLSSEEQEAVYTMRKALNGMKPDEAVDNILNMFARTKNNEEFVQMVRKTKFL